MHAPNDFLVIATNFVYLDVATDAKRLPVNFEGLGVHRDSSVLHRVFTDQDRSRAVAISRAVTVDLIDQAAWSTSLITRSAISVIVSSSSSVRCA